MEFGWPLMLWGTLAVPLLLWAYSRLLRRSARRETALADPHLLRLLWRRPSPVRRHPTSSLQRPPTAPPSSLFPPPSPTNGRDSS